MAYIVAYFEPATSSDETKRCETLVEALDFANSVEWGAAVYSEEEYDTFCCCRQAARTFDDIFDDIPF